MSAELKQLLSQAVTKIEETARNADLSEVFSLDTNTLSASFALNMYRINEEKAVERRKSSYNVFSPELVRAVKAHPVSPEQFELSRQISQNFDLIGRNDDYRIREVVLTVCEQGQNGYILIDRNGNLLVTDHGSTRPRSEPLSPEEILFHGQKIADALEPERIKKLQSFVEQTRNFQWEIYL